MFGAQRTVRNGSLHLPDFRSWWDPDRRPDNVEVSSQFTRHTRLLIVATTVAANYWLYPTGQTLSDRETEVWRSKITFSNLQLLWLQVSTRTWTECFQFKGTSAIISSVFLLCCSLCYKYSSPQATGFLSVQHTEHAQQLSGCAAGFHHQGRLHYTQQHHKCISPVESRGI